MLKPQRFNNIYDFPRNILIKPFVNVKSLEIFNNSLISQTMDSKINSHLKIRSLTLTLILSTIILIQCHDRNVIIFKQETGIIDGKILNYDGVFKSGKLSYFDAISRTIQNEIFVIDSIGNFNLTFNIAHPIYNTATLVIQGHYFSPFLEPGKNLQVLINGNSIEYLGDSGQSNNQMNLLEDTINKKFQEEIKRCRFLHNTNIGYHDYLNEQINLAKLKLEFIEEYEKTHKFDKAVINAIKKESYYSPAKSWINFRFDYSNGPPKARDTLFKDFYADLFRTYPINDFDALVSKEYIDYISNIEEVFSESESYDSLFNFIKKSNSISEGGLILIKRAYDGDKSVFETKEFKEFYNDNNRKKLSELSNRYSVKKLLSKSLDLPRGIGRDLVISQGICSNYFTKYYIHPTEDEWNILKELISTKFILEYLLDKDNNIKIDLPEGQDLQEIPETVKKLASDLNNEIIGKFKGKVVYIDFWATWCGPCRQEIPFSKVLAEQFRNKDVVFLSMCCKSNEQDWKNTIAHEKIPGEHFFVKDIDLDLLTSIYKIKGFPTYILLSKNGEIKNLNAPRPSSNKIIMNDIQSLLDN